MSTSTPFKEPFSATRLPLTPNTNEARTEPSTPWATAKSTQSNFLLRHKLSIQTFKSYLDSSESIPSAHASIYEASVISPSNENIPPTYDENKDPSSENVASSRHQRDIDPQAERRAIEELAWSNSVPAVHAPHRLEPITEKNSLATLQTKASSIFRSHRPTTSQSSKATPKPTDKAATINLRHAPSINTLTPLPTVRPKHRKSFSLPSFARRSKQSSSSSLTITPSNFPTIPKRPPPLRKPTPPGLPTFNTPEAISYRLPAPPAKFRDHFRSTRLVDQEYRRQTTALPRGVVMRGENGELIRGRWRAGPSGHGVGGAHPWYAVRVENTAEMIRYPGNGNERVRVEQPAAVMHGANDDVPQSGDGKTKGKWWEKAAWLCCGIGRDEEGGMKMRTVRHARTVEPLFVGATNTDVVA